MSADNQRTPDRMGQADGDVLAGMYDALWATGTHSSAYKDIEAEVKSGEVILRGHVHSVMHKRDAEQRVAAVPGVQAVRSELVADSELEIEVAQALAANQPTRALILPVGVSEGWVKLGGEVPDAQVLAEAESVAAGVPGVRGVIRLPHLAGRPKNGNHRALQPRVGAAVYFGDGEIGKVVRVVINPHNRLVSHIVVDAHLDVDRREVREDFVIPVGAIRLNTSTGTTLHDSARDGKSRPRFGEADFALAPAGWQPPFPYAFDAVRWPEAVSFRAVSVSTYTQESRLREAPFGG